MSHPEAPPVAPFEPTRPTLLATGLFALWPVLLSLPMLQGRWLASPWSDQYTAGYPFQAWSAEWWKRMGDLPLWNPEIFGGLPFLAAGSGDVFYPTWLLRLLIPTTAAGNLSFFVHYVLAGLFTYLLVRRLGVSWGGAVVSGLAYELSGLIASYPSPGHDGKLFASTMLPLACLALVLALRERRWTGYPLLAAAVALSLLGHFQLAYYLLIAAGLFALYLTFEEGSDAGAKDGMRVGRLGLALAAVLLGFGIAAIQVVPFLEYIPFSPRAQGYRGFAGSVSFAIPWNHVLEFFLKNFVGARETYWGSNPLKLHSEYLGLPVIALALLGARVRERRRLVLWLGGIGLLFLLVSLGGATPFYKLWWALMPLVKKTRAPGMAFFIVAFVTAVCAGVGAERALSSEGRRAARPALVVAACVVLLAVFGVFGHVAHTLAEALQADAGRATGAAADADQSAILWGALGSGIALAIAAAVFGLASGRLAPGVGAVALALGVGTDLWLNARPFWSYIEPYGRDPVIERIAATPLPFRVLNLDAYPGSALMAFDVPDVLGYHGNELRYYDELLGGKNEWRNLGHLPLWNLLAVRYAIVSTGLRGADSIPGFRRVLTAVRVAGGASANLLERTTPAPYARVVPGAIKADSSVIVPALMDPRIDYSRVVLFTTDQPVVPAPLKELPPPSPATATVTTWQPGRMTVALDPAPPAPSYLLIAENWYPDWRAQTDGRPAAVGRGDYSPLVVPIAAGTRAGARSCRSSAHQRGRLITLLSLLALVVTAGAAVAAGRARRV